MMNSAASSSPTLFEKFWKQYFEEVPEVVAFGVYPFVVQLLSYWLINLPFIVYQYGKVEQQQKSRQQHQSSATSSPLTDSSEVEKENSSPKGTSFFANSLIQKYVSFLDHYLINPDHAPIDSEFFSRILWHVTKLHFLVALPLSVIMSLVAEPVFDRSYESLASTSLFSVLFHFLVFIICDEVLFFILHYAFHKVSFLYKHIHYFHHELRYTVSVGCEYAHPLEFLFGNIVPVLLGPFLMRTHLIWYLVWIAYKLLETSYVHSGFDFKLFGYLQFGTNEHAYHHSHYQDAYGSWYGFMDMMFGTMNHFKEYSKKKKLK